MTINLPETQEGLRKLIEFAERGGSGLKMNLDRLKEARIKLELMKKGVRRAEDEL